MPAGVEMVNRNAGNSLLRRTALWESGVTVGVLVGGTSEKDVGDGSRVNVGISVAVSVTR